MAIRIPSATITSARGTSTAAFTLTVYAKALPEQRLEAAAKMDALFGT